MATYEVVAPLAVIKDSVGKLRYYYAGAQVPSDLPSAELERLAALGLIADTSAPADRPAGTASKGAWVDYAVANGMDRADAEAMTKDQLIEQFPG